MTGFVPIPAEESTEDHQVSPDAVQLDYDGEKTRLNTFFLDRYYPDLQKETGFSPEDVDKLRHLKGSEEAELENGLGAAKYQRWKEYETRIQSEQALSKLRRNLSGDDALGEDQAHMLYRTIFDERRRRDEELRIRSYVAPADPRSRLEFEFRDLEIKEESDRRITSAARSFLTEQQLSVLPDAIVDAGLAGYRENLERIRAGMQSRSAQ